MTPSVLLVSMCSRLDLEGLFAAQGQSSQDIPLVTDLLTASVDVGGVIVVQFTGEWKQGERLTF